MEINPHKIEFAKQVKQRAYQALTTNNVQLAKTAIKQYNLIQPHYPRFLKDLSWAKLDPDFCVIGTKEQAVLNYIIKKMNKIIPPPPKKDESSYYEIHQDTHNHYHGDYFNGVNGDVYKKIGGDVNHNVKDSKINSPQSEDSELTKESIKWTILGIKWTKKGIIVATITTIIAILITVNSCCEKPVKFFIQKNYPSNQLIEDSNNGKKVDYETDYGGKNKFSEQKQQNATIIIGNNNNVFNSNEDGNKQVAEKKIDNNNAGGDSDVENPTIAQSSSSVQEESSSSMIKKRIKLDLDDRRTVCTLYEGSDTIVIHSMYAAGLLNSLIADYNDFAVDNGLKTYENNYEKYDDGGGTINNYGVSIHSSIKRTLKNIIDSNKIKCK